MKKLLLSSVVLAAVSCVLAADSSSYVQKDLVANWDGIDKNVAVGTYDDVTTDWEDLVGQYKIHLLNAQATANGFTLRKTNNKIRVGWADYTTVVDILGASTKNYTVEVVASSDNGYNAKLILKSPWNYTTVGQKYGFGLYLVQGDNEQPQVCTYVPTKPSFQVYPWDDFQNQTTNIYTIVYENRQPKALYINGEEMSIPEDAPTRYIGNQTEPMYVGCGGWKEAENKITSSMEGTFCALRFYSRELTEDEIQANVRVDKERFQGIKTATCEVKATTDGEAAMFDTVVTPPFGVSVVTPGASQTFSIADAMADYADGVRAFAAGEGHRVFFKDATVQDGTAASTTETSETFAHQIVGEDTYVTWNFTNEQYLVETTVEGLGAVSETNKWCSVKDGTVQLTAVAGKDRKFISWSGDTEGIADLTSPTIDIPVTQARKLVATFKIQLYPHDVYPTDYTFISDGWTGGTVPAGGSSEADELEARFRSANERGVADFDPDFNPGLVILID